MQAEKKGGVIDKRKGNSEYPVITASLSERRLPGSGPSFPESCMQQEITVDL
jgi:hypothetical protein